MTPLPSTNRTTIRRAAASVLGAAALLLGLSAAPAAAAPSLEIELTRDESLFPVVYHSDQRTDYTVKVTNTGSTDPEAGSPLFCDGIESEPNNGGPKAWQPGALGDPNFPTFSFEWRRNGVLIPGESAQTYTTTDADKGKAIQCTVKGANSFAATRYASLPATVVNPQPATPPPVPVSPTVGASRPTVTGSGTAMRTCATPTNWQVGGVPFNNPADFTFQWLANGEPIPGATATTYTPVVATGTATRTTGTTLTGFSTTTGTFSVGERITGTGIASGTKIVAIDSGAGTIELSAPVTSAGTSGITGGADNGKNLQCQVIGTSAGGALLGISEGFGSSVNGVSVPFSFAVEAPATSVNTTFGQATVEVELPGGFGTYADMFAVPGTQNTPPNGWSCSAPPASGSDPAKAVCTSSSAVAPGTSYPPFVVRTALGADAPDHAVATATVSGGGSPAADSATVAFDFAPAKLFGIEEFSSLVADETGTPHTQAGGHPFSAGELFAFNTYRKLRAHETSLLAFKLGLIDNVKTPITDTPRGFVGNALAIEDLCPAVKDVGDGTCPAASAVGGLDIYLGPFGGDNIKKILIYAVEPEYGHPAQFAFYVPASNGTYVFFPVLRPEDGYAISIEPGPIQTYPAIGGADAKLCSFGVKIVKNTFGGCKEADDPSANSKPLITNPTRCVGEPPTVRLRANSWQNPGHFEVAESVDPMPTNCELVEFEPEMSLEPTSQRADSPTGMDVEITMPTEGLESNEGIAQANLKRVTVTFPKGMAVNAAAGHGLGSCTAAQVGMNPVTGVPNDKEAQCPDSSKIGTIGITTPLIQETLTGDVFIAKQGSDNPFDSNIALYMVFSSKKDGITIKVAGEVKPDPLTGQMTVVFDENPEAPFSSVELHFPQGPRSPLLNPPKCGTYEIKAELTPWSAVDPDNPTPAETVVQSTPYEVTEGPNGGPCPEGKLDPKLDAGSTDPVAGKTSPFVMRLSREDGSQRFTGLEVSPPPGLTAYLKGVPYCSDATLSSISPNAQTGQAQIDAPSCPAASQVGTAVAGAGAGTSLLYVETGKVYLAGPYKGAPLSLAVVTPAVAGPLDLGNVVIRTALHVDPKTAQITAISDPIPTILHGILLNIRDIRVSIDRPNFTLNPTNCNEMSVAAEVQGEGGSSVGLSNRFQVIECAALGFSPNISLSLRGGTKRGDNPALKAVVRPRPGDANIGGAAVTLPRSAFLDQAHIRTICTRVQFAADNCPKAAIYGRAEAVTPLLDEPLRGPVYLRSSDNKLPDLVADLRGPAQQPIKVEAAFRTDSIRGGIRSTLINAFDAPVTRFTLQMQGGKKGLVVNSRNLCAGVNRADARLVGQNGRRFNSRPTVIADGCRKARKGKKRGGAKAKR